MARHFLVKIYQRFRWWFFWNHFQLPAIHNNDLIKTKKLIEPFITEKLCLPPYEGPEDHNDINPLLTIANERQPKAILELGTAFGSTVANLCMVCDAEIYTVNALPEQIEGKITTYILKKEQIGEIYRKYGFEKRVHQIYENTRNLGANEIIPKKSVDLAIIDACHDIDFVINDFLVIQPFLSDHAIIFLHDVDPGMQGHLKDSYLACMVLRKMNFNIHYLENTWWGIWEAKDPKIKRNLRIEFLRSLDNILCKLKTKNYIADAFYLRMLSNLFLPTTKTLPNG